MNLKIIFKRLVLLNLLITLFFVVSIFFIPESSMVESFNQSVEAHDIYYFLAIIWILAFFFNTYLLYNFKKFGKQMYLYIFLASLVLALIGGPLALDPLFYVLDGLAMSISGALLAMLYLTPISKNF
tara:strand:+ start:159 stop:539 length:381 start_codon:yes stop_codon:yes gene_type:complete